MPLQSLSRPSQVSALGCTFWLQTIAPAVHAVVPVAQTPSCRCRRQRRRRGCRRRPCRRSRCRGRRRSRRSGCTLVADDARRDARGGAGRADARRPCCTAGRRPGCPRRRRRCSRCRRRRRSRRSAARSGCRRPRRWCTPWCPGCTTPSWPVVQTSAAAGVAVVDDAVAVVVEAVAGLAPRAARSGCRRRAAGAGQSCPRRRRPGCRWCRRRRRRGCRRRWRRCSRCPCRRRSRRRGQRVARRWAGRSAQKGTVWAHSPMPHVVVAEAVVDRAVAVVVLAVAGLGAGLARGAVWTLPPTQLGTVFGHSPTPQTEVPRPSSTLAVAVVVLAVAGLGRRQRSRRSQAPHWPPTQSLRAALALADVERRRASRCSSPASRRRCSCSPRR